MRLLAYGLSAALFVGLISARANAACGVFEVAKGDVKIQSGKTKKVSSVAAGHKVCSGDTVNAGKNSRAKLKMEDGNELNISPDSQIVLEDYQFNPQQNKKKVLLNVLRGKIRAATQRPNMYNDKAADGTANAFEVKTKSAVAGVRGTDFLTSYDSRSNATEVVTFSGKVEVGQIGPEGKVVNVVQVEAGQKSVVLPNQAPEPPQSVPASELNQMNSETSADTGDAQGAKPAPVAPSNEGTDGNASNNANSNPAGGETASVSAPESGNSSSPQQGPPQAENRGPASAPPPAAGSMINSGELSGGELFRGPNSVPSSGMAGPPIVAPPPVVAPPTVPQCPQCMDAMQKPVKVNVSIKIPGQ